jgi:hypothetical protein
MGYPDTIRLISATGTYLVLVELAKRRLMRRFVD